VAKYERHVLKIENMVEVGSTFFVREQRNTLYWRNV
jgi:hypothetical protein